MKERLKVFGAEIVYLLAAVVIAGAASLIQMIGRVFVRDYNDNLFSGSIFRYNVRHVGSACHEQADSGGCWIR